MYLSSKTLEQMTKECNELKEIKITSEVNLKHAKSELDKINEEFKKIDILPENALDEMNKLKQEYNDFYDKINENLKKAYELIQNLA